MQTTPPKKVFFKIIIPNYNNIAYIKKCLDSILCQTFQDFVVIIIDDLSTDYSDKVCEMYARKFPNKIIFRQVDKKSYAGRCRNIALDYKIDCKYIWAIDGDDYILRRDALQTLFSIAKTCKYDAVFFDGYYDINGHLYPIPSKVAIDLANPAACDPTCHWAKIAKPSCFGRYLENCIVGQDLYHSYLTLDNIKTYINIPDRLYVYRHNTMSISNYAHAAELRKTRERHRIFLKHSLASLIPHMKNKNIAINIQERVQMIDARIAAERNNIMSFTKRKVVISMASFPARKNGMLKVISQLLKQCDRLCIWLNDYKEVPSELKSYPSNKLEVMLAKENSCLKENGRYLMANKYPDAYLLTVDDDLNYPPNYVQKMVEQIDRYGQKCIMAFHGTQFDASMKEIWFPFSHTVPMNVQVHRVGGGVMGFVPSQINFKCPSIEQLKSWDGDASISVWATNNGIKKYVIAHSNIYITEQVDAISNKKMSHVNALCLNKDTVAKRKRIYSQVEHWERI